MNKGYIMVVSQNWSKEFMLGVADCLDNKTVVLGEIEEASTFPWAS